MSDWDTDRTLINQTSFSNDNSDSISAHSTDAHAQEASQSSTVVSEDDNEICSSVTRAIIVDTPQLETRNDTETSPIICADITTDLSKFTQVSNCRPTHDSLSAVQPKERTETVNNISVSLGHLYQTYCKPLPARSFTLITTLVRIAFILLCISKGILSATANALITVKSQSIKIILSVIDLMTFQSLKRLFFCFQLSNYPDYDSGTYLAHIVDSPVHAIYFSDSTPNLSICGKILSKSFTFIVDTVASVSYCKIFSFHEVISCIRHKLHVLFRIFMTLLMLLPNIINAIWSLIIMAKYRMFAVVRRPQPFITSLLQIRPHISDYCNIKKRSQEKTIYKDIETEEMNRCFITRDVTSRNYNTISDTKDDSCNDRLGSDDQIRAIYFSDSTQNLSICGQIGSHYFTFLVDTGAAVSCIDSKLCNLVPELLSIPLKPSTCTTLCSVNGTDILVKGKIMVPFNIDNAQYPFEVYVIEELAYDVILGNDFLQHYLAVIDLKSKTLSFSNSLSRPSIKACPLAIIDCKVRATHTIVLPAHAHESLVVAHLQIPFDPGITD